MRKHLFLPIALASIVLSTGGRSEDPGDSLMLNIADMDLKTVHAGHLFEVTVGPTSVKIWRSEP